MGMPWSSLQDILSKNRHQNQAKADQPKLGRPFALSSDLEVKLYNYIISMQELGFGLTVSVVKKVAYEL
jgi:hypothetical protein